MNFSPDCYNESVDTIQPAHKLINIIKNHTSNGVSLILDVGCGTGITTRLLNGINCDRIIGCDIDPAMIDFAKKHNKSNKVDYIVQDIGVEWNQLDERLRQLEGKVPIIFSNYAITWIWDNRYKVAKNISRLLTKDGLFIGNLIYDGDIFTLVDTTERKRLRSLMPYPTEEQFMGGWLMAFKHGGLNNINIDYWEPTFVIPEKIYLDEYITIPMNWYKLYLNGGNYNSQDIDEMLKKLIYAERCRQIGEKASDGQPLLEVTNRLWQFVAKRKSD